MKEEPKVISQPQRIKDVNLNWDQNFDLLIHFCGYATGQPQLRKMQPFGFT